MKEADRAELVTVYGVRTCLAVFDQRRADIVRIFYRPDRLSQLQKVLKWAASKRLVYRELDEDGMRRVSQSTHHEGVAMVVRPRLCLEATERAVSVGGTWVALDGVGNPHNVGAILRTCAFFEVQGILLGDMAPGTRLSSALMRMAEGGAEFVPVFGCMDLARSLEVMRRCGFEVAGVETDGVALAAGALRAARRILVFGSEQEGLTQRVRRLCAGIYSIPGSGRLGSLNVSVAVGVALARVGGTSG